MTRVAFVFFAWDLPRPEEALAQTTAHWRSWVRQLSIPFEWQEAVINDSYDGWHDVRMMIYGASQSMVHGTNLDRFDDSAAFITLSDVAFQHLLRKIKEGTA